MSSVRLKIFKNPIRVSLFRVLFIEVPKKLRVNPVPFDERDFGVSIFNYVGGFRFLILAILIRIHWPRAGSTTICTCSEIQAAPSRSASWGRLFLSR